MEREKGAVSAACSNCGGDVAMAAQADGSVAALPCQECYGPVEYAPATIVVDPDHESSDDDTGEFPAYFDDEEQD